MSSYFRCGNTDGNCSLARTGETVPSKDWRCPLNHEGCEVLREPVPFVEVHRRKLLIGGGVGLSLLLLLLIISFLSPDPFSSKLAELQGTSSALQGRLSSIESRSSSIPKSADPLPTLQRIVERAQEGVKKVENALDQNLPDVAAKEVKALEDLPKQAEAARQAGHNPAPDSGSVTIEAKELLNQFQEFEEEAEELRFDSEVKGRTDVLTECERILQDTRGAMSRISKIVRPTTRTVDEQRVKEFIEQIQALSSKARSSYAAYIPIPEAPFPLSEANFRIAADSDLAQSLGVPLLSAFLSIKATSPGDGIHYFETTPGGAKVVILTGIASPYEELAKNRCDLVISSMPPSIAEETAYVSAYPGESLGSRSQTEVIALDALTFLAHPDSTSDVLDAEKIDDIPWVTGEPESASYQAARRFGISPARTAKMRPADIVLTDRLAFGAGAFHEEGINIRAKRLAFRASQEARAVKPSPFSIATEDYRYSYRILASHSPQSSDLARKFVDFATSEEGQEIVASSGFVDLRLRPVGGIVDPLILATIGETLGIDDVQQAIRLSTNLRFATGKSTLDIKALADIERLPRYIAGNYPRGKVVILGFTDSTGGPSVNGPLSQERAEEISDELRKSGIDISAAGLGERLPVDTNDTEDGKARNRRAEVWIVP